MTTQEQLKDIRNTGTITYFERTQLLCNGLDALERIKFWQFNKKKKIKMIMDSILRTKIKRYYHD